MAGVYCGDPSDGGCCAGMSACGDQCVYTQYDNNNCGGCGNACSGGRFCNSGNCQCPAGYSVCNGSCLNTASDHQNCGGCGIVCGPNQTCGNGGCCEAGQSFCGGRCTDVTSDSNNCGVCGNVCTDGYCKNSMCYANACKSVDDSPYVDACSKPRRVCSCCSYGGDIYCDRWSTQCLCVDSCSEQLGGDSSTPCREGQAD